MTLKKLVFIINPKSGPRRNRKIQQAILQTVDTAQFETEIVYSEYAHHGTEIARNAASQGAYAVIAVGGDGSVSDVAQGLLGTATILGILPNGSGNGMARTLKIPLDIAEAVKLINKGHNTAMDIGFTNNRLFVSNAGVAFDALIAHKFSKSITRGIFAYSQLVIRYMWRYKAWDFDITIDGKLYREKAFMVSVANGRQFGYNFWIAPMASYTDGLLDVVIIKNFPRLLGGIITLRALTGTIAYSPYVVHYKGSSISITHPKLKLMQTDGDAYPCAPTVNFTIQKGAQRVFVPQ